MRGLVLAFLAFGVVVASTIVGLRLYRGRKEFKVFLGAFAAGVALYCLGFRLLPTDLGFISTGWTETAPIVDFANGLLVLCLVFHGFWSFSYFACVSPSMSSLIALRLRGKAGLSREEAMALQGSPEQGNLLFRRRLPKLVQGRYVGEEAGQYRLLERGATIAAIGSFLKRVINSQAGA